MVGFPNDPNKPVVMGNNPNLKIDAMYAFVAQGPEGEGIMGSTMMIQGVPTFMPFVGADLARVAQLYPLAVQVAKASGREFKVYRFDNKVDITAEYAK